MSSIGSGPGIGSGLSSVGAVRPVGTADPRNLPNVAASAQALVAPGPAPTPPSVPPAQLASAQALSAAMVTSIARDAGPMPVDADRVKVIKKAIETHSYPVVPARISDAMIAAGLLLRTRT